MAFCRCGDLVLFSSKLHTEVNTNVLLLNAFLQSEITQQELARRIGKPKQEITRLFNLHHATKIDAVQLAAKALGKELSLVMV